MLFLMLSTEREEAGPKRVTPELLSSASEERNALPAAFRRLAANLLGDRLNRSPLRWADLGYAQAMRFTSVVFSLALLAACAHGKHSAGDVTWLEERLAAMKLPQPVEPERAHYVERIRRAQALLEAFAATNGWAEEAKIPSFDGIEIFTEPEAFWRRVLELNHMPLNTPVTKGVMASIEGRVLLVLTPAEYERAQPQYAALPDSWLRLVTHEMVHRLHVNILKGKEEAMGPRWFFEGFPTLGSGQDFDLAAGLTYSTAAEALAGAHDVKSPNAYQRFAAALRYFNKKATLRELVTRAGSPDFEAWLAALDQTRPPASPAAAVER